MSIDFKAIQMNKTKMVSKKFICNKKMTFYDNNDYFLQAKDSVSVILCMEMTGSSGAVIYKYTCTPHMFHVYFALFVKFLFDSQAVYCNWCISLTLSKLWKVEIFNISLIQI